jgi:ABC-2 type transport system permease protein
VTTTAVAPPPARAVSVPSGPLEAFGRQLRFIARRDRVRASVWITAVVGLVAVSAASVVALYQTPEDRELYATVSLANVAFKAINGPGYGLDDATAGAVMMNEVSIFTYVAMALMAILLVVRHTRAEEETDRAELVLAAPVGRYATMAATAVWVCAVSLVIGLGLTAAMLAAGLPAAGSVAFGAASTAIGVCFVGVALVAAQLASSGRAATALAGAVLGASFVVRGVGDIGNGWMTWLSPVGITQAIRPYAGERWWVLAVLVLVGASTTGVAVVLLGRRDLGAGILGQSAGPAVGDRRLATPLAMAVRLQRGAFLGWLAGLAVTGYFIGLIADEAEALAESEAIAELIARAGQGSVTDALLATMTLMVALIASGFTVSSVLRLRTEETAGRAEPILAAPVDRRRWLFSHYLVAVGGSLLIMVATGVTIGLGYVSATGRTDQILPVLGAALAQFVAMFVIAAVTLALFAVGTRWALLGWLGVVVSFVVGLLGDTLDLPQWVRNASPFEHVPSLPAAPFQPLPLAVLAAIGVALTAAAMVAIRRRDIG